MTDGPFKNLRLDRHSRRFAEAVQNEAEDYDTQCAFGGHAIVNNILSINQGLIRDLQAFGLEAQLDLNPKSLIESIFANHDRSEFSDDLQRELAMRVHDGDNSIEAIEKALDACIESNIGKMFTRIQEAGFEAYREGPMYKDQLHRLIKGLNQVVKGIDRTRVKNAVKRCDRNEFKRDVRKRTGLDDPIL